MLWIVGLSDSGHIGLYTATTLLAPSVFWLAVTELCSSCGGKRAIFLTMSKGCKYTCATHFGVKNPMMGLVLGYLRSHVGIPSRYGS